MQAMATTGPSEFDSVKCPNCGAQAATAVYQLTGGTGKGLRVPAIASSFMRNYRTICWSNAWSFAASIGFCRTGAWENAETMLSGP